MKGLHTYNYSCFIIVTISIVYSTLWSHNPSNVYITIQQSECDQLLLAAIEGNVATVERLINTRYIDVNTTGEVSTLYDVVLVCG